MSGRCVQRTYYRARSAAAVVALTACTACHSPFGDTAHPMDVTAELTGPAQTYPRLSVGLNRHISEAVRESTYPLEFANVVDNSPKLVTEPVLVALRDPAHPRLDVELPPARFVSLDQTGGWIYGVTVTPQLQALTVLGALASAREVERRLASTGWRRDPSWAADDAAAQAWASTDRATLAVARYTADSAQLRIVLKRTGAVTPSERLRGRNSEGFYADVDVTDLSRLDRYEEHVDQRRRALSGDVTRPLPATAFLNDTLRP